MSSKLPLPSSPAAYNRMKAVRRSGTKAERLLRQVLDELGLQYETDTCPIPNFTRRADILFPHEKIAVFVDGCFWHGCPIHGTWAKANAEFWRKKIEANKRRDEDTNRKLTEHGWQVVRVWEHENPYDAATRISTLLENITWHSVLSSTGDFDCTTEQ